MIRIEWSGRDPFAGLGVLFDARAAEIAARAAAAIAEGAVRRLPAGSRIAEAIAVEPDDAGIALRVQADYAGFLEFGTSRMAARPFLIPAVDDLRGRVMEILP